MEVKRKGRKQRVIVWLDTEDIAKVDAYAKKLTEQRREEDKKRPPSHRRRPAGRSVACRDLIKTNPKLEEGEK